MYKTSDTINVLFASNDKFAPYLGVAMYSFLKNNHQDFGKINIFILDKKISNENKIILEEIARPFIETDLIFIEDDGISEMLGKKVQANRALSAFSRLFAASFLDESIEKVLYLDADSLILSSFKELWETDMEDYYLAAVLDVGPDYVKTAVGLPKDAKFINSGVLLINLKNGVKKVLSLNLLIF